jgi:hypothetical protein
MWLPIFKYLLKFAKPGMFAFKGNGQEYEGAYVETNTGKLYAGESPTDTGLELISIDNDDILYKQDKTVPFESETVYPDPEDYTRGFMYRYFLKNRTTGKIIEVKNINYTKLIEKKYYKGGILKWILTKPAKDIFNQGYLYKGAITRNKANTKEVTFNIPGLDLFITEYDKFVNIESDVKGFKFEELPKNEKIRIIKQQRPNIQKTPKVKPKPFKRPKVNPTLNETPTPLVSAPSAPTNSGGGGGGGLNQSFDEVINDPDNLSMGNNNQNNNSANNYY